MRDKAEESRLQILLAFYQSFVTMLSIFLGFILATTTLVAFLQAPIELRRPTLWLLLTSFAVLDIVFVRTHSRILMECARAEVALPCPPLNDELITLAIACICFSFCAMLVIGGLTILEVIIWGVISSILTAVSYILIRKGKKHEV